MEAIPQITAQALLVRAGAVGIATNIRDPIPVDVELEIVVVTRIDIRKCEAKTGLAGAEITRSFRVVSQSQARDHGQGVGDDAITDCELLPVARGILPRLTVILDGASVDAGRAQRNPAAEIEAAVVSATRHVGNQVTTGVDLNRAVRRRGGIREGTHKVSIR